MRTAFAFTAPLGLAAPSDSCICSTPWSVFQDGSEVPTTYSQQRREPRQTCVCVARYMRRARPATRRRRSQEPGAPGTRSGETRNFARTLGPTANGSLRERGKKYGHRRRDPTPGTARPERIATAREAAPREPEPSLRDFENTSVYHYTVSRTLELSLQSSFQLSLTVLVRYRSWGHI